MRNGDHHSLRSKHPKQTTATIANASSSRKEKKSLRRKKLHGTKKKRAETHRVLIACVRKHDDIPQHYYSHSQKMRGSSGAGHATTATPKNTRQDSRLRRPTIKRAKPINQEKEKQNKTTAQHEQHVFVLSCPILLSVPIFSLAEQSKNGGRFSLTEDDFSSPPCSLALFIVIRLLLVMPKVRESPSPPPLPNKPP